MARPVQERVFRVFGMAARQGACYGPANFGEEERMLTRAGVTAPLLAVGVAPAASAAPFVEFERGQVRPLALSPDQTRLFAVNTPDDRLEIFAVGGSGGLVHTGSVPVGLEPVAV